jgi:hypothetical protein
METVEKPIDLTGTSQAGFGETPVPVQAIIGQKVVPASTLQIFGPGELGENRTVNVADCPADKLYAVGPTMLNSVQAALTVPVSVPVPTFWIEKVLVVLWPTETVSKASAVGVTWQVDWVPTPMHETDPHPAPDNVIVPSCAPITLGT